MSNNLHLNWIEKKYLFDILDLAKQCDECLSAEHLQVIETIEQQLNRYGENDEPTTTDVP